MALLVNKKNNKIIKEIEDENLISIYLGTGEWRIFEKVEPKPIYRTVVESKITSEKKYKKK